MKKEDIGNWIKAGTAYFVSCIVRLLMLLGVMLCILYMVKRVFEWF